MGEISIMTSWLELAIAIQIILFIFITLDNNVWNSRHTFSAWKEWYKTVELTRLDLIRIFFGLPAYILYIIMMLVVFFFQLDFWKVKVTNNESK